MDSKLEILYCVIGGIVFTILFAVLCNVINYLYTYFFIIYYKKIKNRSVSGYILVGDMTSDLYDITIDDNVMKIKKSCLEKSTYSKASFQRIFDYRDKDNEEDDSFFFGIQLDSYGNPYSHEYCPRNYPTYYFLRLGFLLVKEEHLYDYDRWKSRMDDLIKDTIIEYVEDGEKYFNFLCESIWNHKYQNLIMIPEFRRNKMAKKILDKRMTIADLAAQLKKICR